MGVTGSFNYGSNLSGGGDPQMKTFTLDTNCIIDVAQSRPDKSHILALRDAHCTGTVNVAVVGISASEKQMSGAYLSTFAAFQAELQSCGLDSLDMLKPVGYWDITFWGWCVWSNPALIALEQAIHAAMFPGSQFELADHIARSAKTEHNAKVEWRNQKCDVLALASHVANRRDVFVTRDADFNAARSVSGVGQIVRPDQAAAML